jgi:uncharacterized alkaline shock family protein YloU
MEDLMKFTTFNSFGKISISRRAISKVAAVAVQECYGVVGLVNPTFNRESKSHGYKGIVLSSNETDIIMVDVYVVLRYSVTISAVSESIRKAVKYSIENFTGMIVKGVDVHVIDVR